MSCIKLGVGETEIEVSSNHVLQRLCGSLEEQVVLE